MKKIILMILISSALISGCATQKPMYEYSNYSESFYGMKKEGGAETSDEWKTTLEDIISKSNASITRVPPGVYANLGYLYLKMNNNEQAIFYFEEEKKIYPESIKFMDNLISKAKAEENPS